MNCYSLVLDHHKYDPYRQQDIANPEYIEKREYPDV